jgi:hypothetical protein
LSNLNPELTGILFKLNPELTGILFKLNPELTGILYLSGTLDKVQI